jgi:hypothetical protein
MQSPGFEIYNGTIWPLQIALKQVGPLYYGIVQPGQYFRRDTGAVWFTINASIALDGKEHISDWDCVWPVAAIVGTVALGALTGGAGAFAAAGTFAASTGVMAGITTAMAVVSGAVLGAVTSGAAASLLAKVFSNANADVSEAGCYAGPPWPFRTDVRTWKVTGSPYLQARSDGKMDLIPAALHIG